jgi:hypothetical protein
MSYCLYKEYNNLNSYRGLSVTVMTVTEKMMTVTDAKVRYL